MGNTFDWPYQPIQISVYAILVRLCCPMIRVHLVFTYSEPIQDQQLGDDTVLLDVTNLCQRDKRSSTLQGQQLLDFPIQTCSRHDIRGQGGLQDTEHGLDLLHSRLWNRPALRTRGLQNEPVMLFETWFLRGTMHERCPFSRQAALGEDVATWMAWLRRVWSDRDRSSTSTETS